jgi:hypothetical protein
MYIYATTMMSVTAPRIQRKDDQLTGYVHLSTYFYTYTCVYIFHICIYMHLCIYIYLYINLHADVYECIYIYVLKCTSLYVFICLYIYTYNTYTYIHTHILPSPLLMSSSMTVLSTPVANTLQITCII